MATAHRRESMIALRATHQAFKVACDVGYEPIDATRVACSACGAELDWRNNTVGSVIMCVKCGMTTDVPPHIKPLTPLPAPTPWEPWLYLCRKVEQIVESPYGPVPVWLGVFFVLCVLSVLGMLAYTLIKLPGH